MLIKIAYAYKIAGKEIVNVNYKEVTFSHTIKGNCYI